MMSCDIAMDVRQVLNVTTTNPAQGLASGISYTASTVGVYKCWRADISKVGDYYMTSPRLHVQM